MSDFGPALQELLDMTGRVALVTGGAKNLGRTEACALAELGAQVIITSRDPDAARATAEEMSERAKTPVAGMRLIVNEEDSVGEVFDEVRERFGRLDCLVNNAVAVRVTEKPTAFHRGLEDWQVGLDVSLTGPFLCCRAASNIMKLQESGSIINISSMHGLIGRDLQLYEDTGMTTNLLDYAASKAGILGLTNQLAAQLGPYGIRCNAIVPGGFERAQPEEFIRRYSAMTPLRRMGRDLVDIKGVIALLASDAGAYITGTSVVIDGGFSMTK